MDIFQNLPKGGTKFYEFNLSGLRAYANFTQRDTGAGKSVLLPKQK